MSKISTLVLTTFLTTACITQGLASVLSEETGDVKKSFNFGSNDSNPFKFKNFGEPEGDRIWTTSTECFVKLPIIDGVTRLSHVQFTARAFANETHPQKLRVLLNDDEVIAEGEYKNSDLNTFDIDIPLTLVGKAKFQFMIPEACQPIIFDPNNSDGRTLGFWFTGAELTYSAIKKPSAVVVDTLTTSTPTLGDAGDTSKTPSSSHSSSSSEDLTKLGGGAIVKTKSSSSSSSEEGTKSDGDLSGTGIGTNSGVIVNATLTSSNPLGDNDLNDILAQLGLGFVEVTPDDGTLTSKLTPTSNPLSGSILNPFAPVVVTSSHPLTVSSTEVDLDALLGNSSTTPSALPTTEIKTEGSDDEDKSATPVVEVKTNTVSNAKYVWVQAPQNLSKTKKKQWNANQRALEKKFYEEQRKTNK